MGYLDLSTILLFRLLMVTVHEQSWCTRMVMMVMFLGVLVASDMLQIQETLELPFATGTKSLQT